MRDVVTRGLESEKRDVRRGKKRWRSQKRMSQPLEMNLKERTREMETKPDLIFVCVFHRIDNTPPQTAL
jgi:hypothetical protein